MTRQGPLFERLKALPTGEELLESLQSRLLDDTAQDWRGQSLHSMSGDNMFTDRFVGLFLSSIGNNFAGLENIPVEAIMIFIGQNENIRSRILKYLQEAPDIFSYALAESVFRAAIEAGDSTVTRFLLQNQLADPNAKIDDLTPVEKAAGLHHLEVTRCLVEAGADVNKTYGEADRFSHQGALEHAIRKWGDYVPVDPLLVDVILCSGAIVRADLLGAAIRWGAEDVVDRLMSRLSPAEHTRCLEHGLYTSSESILADATKYLGKDLSLKVVRQLLHACQDVHDSHCMRSAGLGPLQPPPFESVMLYAAKKTNMEVLQLLIPYVSQRAMNYGLVGAVSSGSLIMVQFLLEKGGSISASIRAKRGRYDTEGFRDFITTPLAEAIRGSSNELILLLEKEGALAEISHPDGDHLEAALHAVSEVGDMAYLDKLFQLIPVPRIKNSSGALALAIRAGNEEVAMALLAVGAQSRVSSTIIQVLTSGSKHLLTALLETGISMDRHDDALSVAVKRGDMSIIEDLVYMGADININCRSAWSTRPSPLSAAVLTGDSNLVEYLLKHGADPANENAFMNAMKHNRELLSLLFQEFRKRYPHGLPNFGAGVFYHVLQIGNGDLLDRCLDAKLDVNSSSEINYEQRLNVLGSLITKQGNTRLDLVTKLLDAGADINAIASKPSSSASRQQTALLLAIETKSLPLVSLLIQRDADVHKAARLGLNRTPLQKACEVGSYPIVRLLLDCHTDVNENPAFKEGGTALQLAAKSGSVKIAQLLLDHGALVNAQPSQVFGHSAIDNAARYGRLDMIELLCNASDRPFTREEYRGAMAAARENGHRACSLLLQRLSSTSQRLIQIPV